MEQVRVCGGGQVGRAVSCHLEAPVHHAVAARPRARQVDDGFGTRSSGPRQQGFKGIFVIVLLATKILLHVDLTAMELGTIQLSDGSACFFCILKSHGAPPLGEGMAVPLVPSVGGHSRPGDAAHLPEMGLQVSPRRPERQVPHVDLLDRPVVTPANLLPCHVPWPQSAASNARHASGNDARGIVRVRREVKLDVVVHQQRGLALLGHRAGRYGGEVHEDGIAAVVRPYPTDALEV
mmetsp:Transcript_31099/g.96825  ORF Transcript_31099/g.96825 Transcript_31099/m.96825 type:complete len:236 (+) Transcript_31099:173-880(+)